MQDEDSIGIENGSGDHKYFTLVPNYILNHSSATDQALYLHMKRFAGERGVCYASKKTLMAKMGIGKVTLNTSLEYLLDHQWIEHVGMAKVNGNGGPQEVNVYRIMDIWRLNNEHYKGGSETAYPTQRGVQDDSKGGSETAPKKNHIKEDIPEILKSRISVSSFQRNPIPRKRFKAYNEADPGDDLPAVDLDGNSVDDEAVKGVEPNLLKSYRSMLKWAEERRGFGFPFPLKQYAAFKSARKADITPSQLKSRWEELEQDSFYATKGFDWTDVVSSFSKRNNDYGGS